jgi:hypothetical protein
MQKFSYVLALIIFVCIGNNIQAQSNEYYLGVFSNTTSTIKFTIGAYPNTISQSTRSDGTIFSAMSVAIVNNEKAEPIIWSDYKMYVLLKDGTLFYNFLTNSTTGDYACKYTVPTGETHLQYYCFEKVFSATDIDKVWLSFSDSHFQPLMLYKDTFTPETAPTETPAPSPAKKPAKK